MSDLRCIGDAVAGKAGRVRLVVLDADGVLTDGGIVVFADGNESRSFFSRDGLGIRLGQRAGLSFAIISGRTSPVVAQRALELGLVECVQGVKDKGACLEALASRHGIDLREVGYMGDDLVDLPALARAGFSAAPADADSVVLGRVDWVATRAGGRGAVRELVELVLKASGAWERVAASYLEGG